jgi:hypothetical protein
VQLLPLALVPLWQTLHRAPLQRRIAFGAAILVYLAARAAELNDRTLYAATGFISGHTLKHLLATAAAALVISTLASRAQSRGRYPKSSSGVTYRDSDNNLGSESRVQVTLLRVGKINGVVFQVGTFDSDLFAGGMLNSTFFFHAFDFTNYAYFLQITLTRTALGGDTRIYRVRLS